MVTALWTVYKWCKEKDIHEFDMKQVKNMMGKNEYARFGDWKKFGGLVYTPEGNNHKGVYGMNMERCDGFFRNEYQIPMRIWKDPVTKELKPEDYRTIKEIPTLYQLLSEDGEYVARYREPRNLFSE